MSPARFRLHLHPSSEQHGEVALRSIPWRGGAQRPRTRGCELPEALEAVDALVQRGIRGTIAVDVLEPSAPLGAWWPADGTRHFVMPDPPVFWVQYGRWHVLSGELLSDLAEWWVPCGSHEQADLRTRYRGLDAHVCVAAEPVCPVRFTRPVIVPECGRPSVAGPIRGPDGRVGLVLPAERRSRLEHWTRLETRARLMGEGDSTPWFASTPAWPASSEVASSLIALLDRSASLSDESARLFTQSPFEVPREVSRSALEWFGFMQGRALSDGRVHQMCQALAPGAQWHLAESGTLEAVGTAVDILGGSLIHEVRLHLEAQGERGPFMGELPFALERGDSAKKVAAQVGRPTQSSPGVFGDGWVDVREGETVVRLWFRGRPRGLVRVDLIAAKWA